MSGESLQDVVIIGAGLTGLSLAVNLKQTYPDKHVLIVEKSKGCGGRMATRRINDLRFDHGAQFIKISHESEKWIDLWQQHQVIQKFPSTSINAVCGKSGITQLAKTLARDLNIQYTQRAQTLKLCADHWEIACDTGLFLQAKTVVSTSPLPQSLELLEKSNLSYDSKLSKIRYSPAIVLLIETHTDFEPNLIYNEEISNDVFSVCAQHKKGNATTPAWTVVMSSTWSQNHFEDNDEQILGLASEILIQSFPNLLIQSSQIKKWRYCRPETRWDNYFHTPHPNLYLAGDAFGGSSLLGALRSSEAVFESLKNVSV